MSHACPADVRAALGACGPDTKPFDLDGLEAWCRVWAVHDADTCACVLDVGGGCLRRATFRLEGVDAAEMHSRDAREKALAVEARDRLLRWLDPDLFPAGQGGWPSKDVKRMLAGKVVLAFARCGKPDKYGRTLLRLFRSPDDATSANAVLLRGAGVDAYDGGHKEKNFLAV